MPILIVDDNKAHLYALERMLYHAGYLVISADTAHLAASLAKSESPSLILLDIHLPDGDGFDVFKGVRGNPATSDIPIVFHSATMQAGEARTRSEVLHAEGFLTYPIDRQQLLAVVLGVTTRRPPKRRTE